MNKHDRIYELIDELNKYTKLYDEGDPAITDKEYDDLYFELQNLEKETGLIFGNSPTQKIDYQIVNQLNKVEHNHPMLSLDKTKEIEDIVSFIGDKECIAMAKMDGLTCSLRYENGQLVSAETRGNGIIGEDIFNNIKFVKGVPIEINYKEELIVDGEVICTYEDFENFKNDYKNPRNFASGSIRLLDSCESAQRKLTFITWDCIKGINKPTLSEKLIQLSELGFLIVPLILTVNNNNKTEMINHIIFLLKDWAKNESYPIDGLVFKYNNCAYYQSLGYTGHHFRGGLAFKFYDEEYETNLRDIEWSMGKTGQLTPVAIFDPIDDGESIVERASLHNINIMNQILGMYPYKGQKIWVAKMNMIIPQVMRANPSFYSEPGVDDMDRLLILPKKCPCCGEPTYIKDDFLYCSNPDCEGKFINKLDHFVGKKGLDIKGLSKATLQKLIDWDWVTKLRDLFTLELHRDEWIKKDGFGIKSVDKILTTIQDSRNCELWQFISGLSIPLIGTTYAKEICKHEVDWHNIREDIEKGYDFAKWDGFGYEMNNAIHKFNYDEADELVDNVLYLKNSLYKDKQTEENKSSLVNGKVFCITGKLSTFKNRDEAKDKIEMAGGKVTSAVTSNTNYLVNNDISSTSSKNVKAKSLNIPIISEEDLLAML